MKIKRFIGGTLESNGYIISVKPEGEAFIIDPGYNPKKFIKYIEENQLKLKGVLLTHLHHDHVGGAEKISSHFNCPIYMHEDDAFVYRGKVDIRLKDGDNLDLDGETLDIISTPGHTKGSICIMSKKSRVCFTGDTIFDTDLGRSDLEGGSEEDMKNSICNVIDKWDNDINIYPGHDNGCNMKFVRQHNTEFNGLLKEGKR